MKGRMKETQRQAEMEGRKKCRKRSSAFVNERFRCD